MSEPTKWSVIEQYREIVKNAPEGATHFEAVDSRYKTRTIDNYMRVDLLRTIIAQHDRIAELERERDERDIEQQIKALEDFANLTLIPSMGDGFSSQFCSGFESALGHAAQVVDQLRKGGE